MKEGFTLLEVLVVAAIVSTLMVLAVPQFTKFNRSQELQNSALDLQSALRTAQTNAVSGVKCNVTAGSVNWSLKLTGAQSYTIDALCAGSPPPASTVGRSYNLPEGVLISRLSFFNSADAEICSELPLNDYKIIFSNVSGKVSYSRPGGSACTDDNLTAAKKAVITLQLGDSASTIKKVVVEKSGAVYISS